VRIIEPSFSLYTTLGDALTPELGIKMLKWIESMARISHRSEFLQTESSWQRFIQAVVLDRADWSVAEHAHVTAVLRVDRGISHELVRHRHFSITMESTRFVNGAKKYTEGLEFIKPIELKEIEEFSWKDTLSRCEWSYFNILKESRPQEARSVLPTCVATTLSLTANLRNWRHFLNMRSTKESHPDMRRIVNPMLVEFQRVIPLLFSDLTPNERQADGQRKAR